MILAAIYFFMGLRWKNILGEKNIEISSLTGFSQICISNFINTFVPARGGDIYRGYLSSEGEKNTLDTSVMVLMERVIDTVVIAFFLGLSVLSFYPGAGLEVYVILAFLFIAAGFIGLKILRELEELPVDLLNRYYKTFRTSITENFQTDRIFGLAFLTSVIWILGVARTQTVFTGLGIDLGLGAVAVVTFSWALIAAIPLTPSGFGTTDAAVFVILGVYGVSSSDAAAFILMNRVILQGIPLLTGGSFYLKKQLEN